MTATIDLTTQTPQQIDEQLAEIYGRYYRALDQAEALAARIANYRANNLKAEQGERYYSVTSDADLAEYDARLEAMSAERTLILAEASPLNAEFDRRGGWTRAYLVTNAGGHVHNTMACNTCFSTTRFAWLTDLSDHVEDEIVGLAGEQACTVCYPSAPVDVLKRKSQIELPERKAARLEREAKRAAKVAKELHDPATGQILREVEVPFGRGSSSTADLPNGLRNGSEIGKTERGAELAALAGLKSLLFYGESHPSAPAWKATAERVAGALAAKRGDSDIEILRDLQARAAKAHKREMTS